MLLGIISTILNIIGIVGFFTNNYVLLIIGAVATLVESLIGFFTGAQKGLGLTTMIIFSFICYLIIKNVFLAVALGLCIDGFVLFVGGTIFLLVVNKKMKNQN